MKNKAFTLIELLVVIVIIGILATISTATFNSHILKARDIEKRVVLKNLQDTLLAALIETADSPNYVNPLNSSNPNTTSCSSYDCPHEQAIAIITSEGFDLSLLGDEHSLVYLIATDSTDKFVLAYCSEDPSSDVIISGNVSGMEPYFDCEGGTTPLAGTQRVNVDEWVPEENYYFEIDALMESAGGYINSCGISLSGGVPSYSDCEVID